MSLQAPKPQLRFPLLTRLWEIRIPTLSTAPVIMGLPKPREMFVPAPLWGHKPQRLRREVHFPGSRDWLPCLHSYLVHVVPRWGPWELLESPRAATELRAVTPDS